MTSWLYETGTTGVTCAQAVGLAVTRGAVPYKASGVMFPPLL